MKAHENGSQHDEWTLSAAFLRLGRGFHDGKVDGVIETPASLTFLGSTEVLKLKKRKKGSETDCLAARRDDCEREIQRNRRLASEVYLGVAGITRDHDGALSIDGPGRAIDWVVRMRRLPSARMLDSLLGQRGSELVSFADRSELAQVLTRFYRDAPVPSIAPEAYVRKRIGRIRRNCRHLLRLMDRAHPLIHRIHGRQLQFVALERPLLLDRLIQGRVVEAHGDLRPEHICLATSPVVFDVQEDAERQLDAAEDLCLLALECERRQAGDFGRNVIGLYAEASGDHPASKLLEFYKSSWASERARVAALDTTVDKTDAAVNAQSYLKLAERNFGPASRPLCILVRGRRSPGKSAFVKKLGRVLGLGIVRMDSLELLCDATSMLASGCSLAVDGTFVTLDGLEIFRSTAEGLGATFLGVTLTNQEVGGDALSEELKNRFDPGGMNVALEDVKSMQGGRLEPVLTQLKILLEKTDDLDGGPSMPRPDAARGDSVSP